MSPTSRPALQGLRVLDLSRLLPGPYMTQLLADLGAEVIKIEDPRGGDYLRHLPPQRDGINAVFAAIHRGKKSVCLDLKHKDDRRVFMQLCQSADVLVESFRPGVMERLGLGPQEVQAVAPRVVYCRISGYGQQGDDVDRAGHDLNYAARAGMLSLTSPPQVPPVQVADLVGGALLPAVQILAALRQRDRDGKACVIDAAMIDGAWTMMIWPLARHLLAGEELAPGQGLLHGAVPSYEIYPTADGALALAALEPKFWKPLCDHLGVPELAERGLDRGAAGLQVKERLAAIFASRTTAQWQQELAGLDVCVSPLRDAQRAHLDDPALRGRDLVGQVWMQGTPVRMPLTPVRVGADHRSRQGPPGLGEHSDEIRAELDKKNA